jgi:hypothetical protein
MINLGAVQVGPRCSNKPSPDRGHETQPWGEPAPGLRYSYAHEQGAVARMKLCTEEL